MAKLDLNDANQWQGAARQSGWRVAEFARELKISRRQLQRYTQTSFHRSPQKWLDEQRLLIASRELKTIRSVKIVAYELGFKQQSHFTRRFKNFYGVTPSQFVDKP